MLKSQLLGNSALVTTCVRSLFTSSSPLLAKGVRYRALNPTLQYAHNKKRVKLSGFKDVPIFAPDNTSLVDLPPPALYDTEFLPEEDRDSREADPNRKFSMRKKFFYERNRRILDKAKLIVVLQPMNDDGFWAMMNKLGDAFYTSHFRNGLVHIKDKPYAPIKTLFKGPVRVLLQDDETKIVSSLKKLKQVLKEYPDTLYLGGAADGGAGLQHDLEALLEYESKDHIRATMIGILNSVSEVCKVLDYPTMSLGRVMDHHGKQVSGESAGDAAKAE